MRGAGKTPAQTGEQGLFRLVYQAHEVYKAEVLTHRKCYRRFMLDFIHSTQYHDATDAWSKNEHQKNYCIVSELLETMKSWYANTSVSLPWTKPKLKNCSIHSIHPNISKQNPGYKVSKTAVNQNSPLCQIPMSH